MEGRGVCASERGLVGRGEGGVGLEVGVHHPDTHWEDLVPPPPPPPPPSCPQCVERRQGEDGRSSGGDVTVQAFLAVRGGGRVRVEAPALRGAHSSRPARPVVVAGLPRALGSLPLGSLPRHAAVT